MVCYHGFKKQTNNELIVLDVWVAKNQAFAQCGSDTFVFW